MGAIHELREDFRRYRHYHPEYRWMFLLLDLVTVLFKLALFAGFVYACYYIINRGELPFQSALKNPPVAINTPDVSKDSERELTGERIALLKSIAAKEASKEASTDKTIPKPVVITPTLESKPAVDTRKVELIGSAEESSITVQPVTALLEATPVSFVEPTSQGFGYKYPRNLDQPIPIATTTPTVVQVASAAAQPATTYDAIEYQYTEVDQADGIQGRDWVLSQFPGYYTVQVALTVNRPFLLKFAKKIPSDYVSAIYPERVNNKGSVQYSLSVGEFADKQSAVEFLEALPSETRRYGAHIRTFKEIQQKAVQFSSDIIR